MPPRGHFVIVRQEFRLRCGAGSALPLSGWRQSMLDVHQENVHITLSL